MIEPSEGLYVDVQDSSGPVQRWTCPVATPRQASYINSLLVKPCEGASFKIIEELRGCEPTLPGSNGKHFQHPI